MQEFILITGIVLKTVPIGDYDRRVCLLTKERGKIAAFAKGARRQNSRLMASTNLFSFGEFKLYSGKTSYSIMEANISNYFEPLREDFKAAYYGMYFMEVMDYYTRENNDEKDMLKLLYQSLRALLNENLNKELVRYIFEMKAMVLNGEFPGIPEEKHLSESATYTIDYIMRSTIEKLYTFTIKEEVLDEIRQVANEYRKRYLDRDFKSLAILKSIQ